MDDTLLPVVLNDRHAGLDKGPYKGGKKRELLSVLLPVQLDRPPSGPDLDKGRGELTEPLDNALLVIILSPTRLTPLLKPLEHDLLRSREEQHSSRRTDGLVELDGLIHLAREAVD